MRIRRAFHREVETARALRIRPWRPHAIAAGLTGLFLGIAGGLPLADRDPRPVVAAILLVATVPWIARIFPATWRVSMASVLLVALTARFAAAVVIQDASVAFGHEGWVTGDDWSYAEVSWGIASYLHGTPYAGYLPPDWNTDVYLIGTYVDIETAVFFLFGRQVLLMEFVNSWALVLAASILFDLARRLFGQRAALGTSVAILWYPSIFAWSVLNLKDALSILLITATFWILLRVQRAPTWAWLVALFVVLYAVESLRRYIYLLLLLAVVVGLAASARSLAGRPRVVNAVGVLVAVILFVSDFSSASWFGRIDLDLLQTFRQAMAQGARTSFQEPPPVRLDEGRSYVVLTSATPSPTPAPTEPPTSGSPRPRPSAAPTCTSGVRHVDRASTLVVSALASPPPAPPGTVYVCPGDVLVVGSDATPAPLAEQRPLEVRESVKFVIRPNPVGGVDRAVIRQFDSLQSTLAYLPQGLAYALMAPFPWALQRTLDLVTAPEMIAWYVLLILAAASAWRLRRRWAELLALLVYLGGLVLILSLVEGNYGTLYRHRAMLIPFVVMLAMPALVDAIGSLRQRRGSQGQPASS